MEHDEAIALIEGAITEVGGTWADLGAGAGMFTRALASLVGPGGVVYAVDRDANALRQLARPGRGDAGAIHTLVGDFTERLELPPLDGVLVANALHFVPYPEQARVVAQIGALLMESGVIVVVEYERRAANRWVPYPIAYSALGALAREAGLDDPVRLAEMPSQYSGAIYSAVVRRSRPR